MPQPHLPGVLAMTCVSADDTPPGLARLLGNESLPPASCVRGVWLSAWGLHRSVPTGTQPLLLSGTNWGDNGPEEDRTIAGWLAAGDLVRLGRMLPPFAALGLAPDGLRVAADQLGFRQIFFTTGQNWGALSTSALLLARLRSTMTGQPLVIDTDAMLLQSQLGWQLGERTLFDGVTKMAPGQSVMLKPSGLTVQPAPTAHSETGSLTMDEAVGSATELLRETLESWLEAAESPMSQLTGGQDSRILLSAIPRHRRREVRAMTLDTTGTADARIAGDIATRFGMHHSTMTLDGLDALTPDDVFHRVMIEARDHDCMNDPLARSVTSWAEEWFDQGARLSGVGGEIARGFYYGGIVRPVPVTRHRTAGLARWRMLANEPVELGALAAARRNDALPLSLGLIHDVLTETGEEWHTATDELYARHRIPRWAGVGESSVTFRRVLMNPLLHHGYIDIARRLSPANKQRSRFVARLQVSLDPELADLPLDNRPAPRFLVDGGWANGARRLASSSRRAGRKIAQRMGRTSRPSAGGTVVARKVAAHLRHHPRILNPVRATGFFDDQWLDDVTSGKVHPTPGSLALLMNVLAATAEE